MSAFVEFASSTPGLAVAGLIAAYHVLLMIDRVKHPQSAGIVMSVSPVKTILQAVMCLLMAAIVILTLYLDNHYLVKLLALIFALVVALAYIGGEKLVRYVLRKLTEISKSQSKKDDAS